MLKTTPQENKELQLLVANVFKEMVSTGTHTVTVTYSGSGDEGWSDLVICLDEQGKKTQMKENSALSVFEFIDQNIILGWENNEGGDGTLVFTIPNIFTIKHGLYEHVIEYTDYVWSPGGFVLKRGSKASANDLDTFKEDIEPILRMIEVLRKGSPGITGVTCIIRGEVDSGLQSEVFVEDSILESSRYELGTSEKFYNVEGQYVTAATYIADLSIIIAERLCGSLGEYDTATVTYYNHPLSLCKVKCEVETLVPKTYTYVM